MMYSNNNGYQGQGQAVSSYPQAQGYGQAPMYGTAPQQMQGYSQEQSSYVSQTRSEKKVPYPVFLEKTNPNGGLESMIGTIEGFIDKITTQVVNTNNGPSTVTKITLNVVLSDYDLREFPKEFHEFASVKFNVSFWGKTAESIAQHEYLHGTRLETGVKQLKVSSFPKKDGTLYYSIDCKGFSKFPIIRVKGKGEAIPVTLIGQQIKANGGGQYAQAQNLGFQEVSHQPAVSAPQSGYGQSVMHQQGTQSIQTYSQAGGQPSYPQPQQLGSQNVYQGSYQDLFQTANLVPNGKGNRNMPY